MVKLCIIETENHHEVIRSLVQSIYGLDYAITIITHAKCIPFITNLKVCRLLDYNETSFNAEIYFKEYSYDRILFTTPPPFTYTEFRFLYTRSYLLIHNIHFWMSPYEHLFFWLKPKKKPIINLLKCIKYLPEIVLKRRPFLDSFKKVLAPSSSLYYEHKTGLDGFLDLRYPSDRKETDCKGSFTIVVPGTINLSRNYTELLQYLDQIARENEHHIIVQFLGKGTLDININNPFLSLKTYPDGLTQKNFDRIMHCADMGMLQVEQDKSYKGILELKGTTNISGAVNDFYRYGIPALIPSFYPIDHKTGLFHHYDRDKLENLLSRWIVNKQYLEHFEAFNSYREILVQQVREHNHSVLSE